MTNRTMCEALGEMRKCYKTRNFSYLLGLIEEVQSMGNRMESAIWDKNGIEGIRETLSELKKERKATKKECDDAKETLEKIETVIAASKIKVVELGVLETEAKERLIKLSERAKDIEYADWQERKK